MDLEIVKATRQKGVVAFTRYCEEKRRYSNNIFCFFEGEDAKYYCPRIEKHTNYSFDKITKYNCGGKKGVLSAMNLINNNNMEDDITKAFFVDRDFDNTIYECEYLYQTPCYSIENFYTSIAAFKKMINREFGINVSESDFEKCCEDYIKRQSEFHENTLLINAWLFCQRKNEGNTENKVRLSDFKVSKMFSEISIEKVIVKEEINYNLLKKNFPNALEISEEELLNQINCFAKGNYGMIFRGKFEIEFLKKIIDSIKTKNRVGVYFSQKYTSVNIDPNVNTLSSLSEYADTPECLLEFLKRF